MLKSIVLILGIAAYAGAASAEPSGAPATDGHHFKSLFPIGIVAGGLVPKRAR